MKLTCAGLVSQHHGTRWYGGQQFFWRRSCKRKITSRSKDAFQLADQIEIWRVLILVFEIVMVIVFGRWRRDQSLIGSQWWTRHAGSMTRFVMNTRGTRRGKTLYSRSQNLLAECNVSWIGHRINCGHGHYWSWSCGDHGFDHFLDRLLTKCNCCKKNSWNWFKK